MVSLDAAPARRKRIAIFGDHAASEHAALYARVGAAMTKADAEIVVMAPSGASTLVEALAGTAARPLLLIGPADASVPAGSELLAAGSPGLARVELVQRIDAMVGLPSRLGPVTDLFLTWSACRDAGTLLPVGLLNQKKAFEVVRGFMSDVAGVGIGRTDHFVQFAETIEDLLARVLRMDKVAAMETADASAPER